MSVAANLDSTTRQRFGRLIIIRSSAMRLYNRYDFDSEHYASLDCNQRTWKSIDTKVGCSFIIKRQEIERSKV